MNFVRNGGLGHCETKQIVVEKSCNKLLDKIVFFEKSDLKCIEML